MIVALLVPVDHYVAVVTALASLNLPISQGLPTNVWGEGAGGWKTKLFPSPPSPHPSTCFPRYAFHSQEWPLLREWKHVQMKGSGIPSRRSNKSVFKIGGPFRDTGAGWGGVGPGTFTLALPAQPESAPLPGHPPTGKGCPFSLKSQKEIRGGLSLVPSAEEHPPEWESCEPCKCAVEGTKMTSAGAAPRLTVIASCRQVCRA